MAAMDYLYAKDPAVANQLFPDSDSAWSILLSVMPTAILPVVESATNYDTFRNRPIVSPWDLGLDKELQYNRWTSEFAKDVGPKIGLAPAKLDHLMYGYLAGLGRSGVGLVDLARGEHGERSSASVRRWPLVGDPINVFNRPYAGSDAQSIQDLYTARDVLAGAKASIETWAARGEWEKVDEKLAAISERYGKDIWDRATFINQSIDVLSELRGRVDWTWANETLGPVQKQREQDRIFELMVNVARVVLGKPRLPSRFVASDVPAMPEAAREAR